MIVKAYEKGKCKIYMRAERHNLFTIIYINGNQSDYIYNRDMDIDSASELFDILVERDSEELNFDIKVEEK